MIIKFGPDATTRPQQALVSSIKAASTFMLVFLLMLVLVVLQGISLAGFPDGLRVLFVPQLVLVFVCFFLLCLFGIWLRAYKEAYRYFQITDLGLEIQNRRIKIKALRLIPKKEYISALVQQDGMLVLYWGRSNFKRVISFGPGSIGKSAEICLVLGLAPIGKEK